MENEWVIEGPDLYKKFCIIHNKCGYVFYFGVCCLICGKNNNVLDIPKYLLMQRDLLNG